MKVLEWVFLDDSSRKDKRYVVVFLHNGGLHKVHFGAKQGKTYIDHQDPDIRRRWLARHSKMPIRGKLAEDVWDIDPTSPSTLSRYLLWEHTDLDTAIKKYIKKFDL